MVLPLGMKLLCRGPMRSSKKRLKPVNKNPSDYLIDHNAETNKAKLLKSSWPLLFWNLDNQGLS